MKPSFLNLPLAVVLSLTTAFVAAGCINQAIAAEAAEGTESAKPALVVESKSIAPPPVSKGEYAIDPDDKEHENERKEVEAVINTIESQWNAHDLKSYMANYSEDYINNDGLDKKAVQSLTEEFWKTYPDAHSASRIKSIRVEGNYATVES
ncbi:MAG: hypothetical protein KGS72_03470, partial [Cyanobacteria bacterium REEB67]|nr:hypothetical protein [Cyanobacteria bacterium REEB67]